MVLINIILIALHYINKNLLLYVILIAHDNELKFYYGISGKTMGVKTPRFLLLTHYFAFADAPSVENKGIIRLRINVCNIIH